ncbi:MAG: 50S ribosomal protein L18 [Deltaproteobacteria bacterium]|nr:50S ribosomal protein L18 [Deltaproteobacteria bacterium]
MKSLKKQTHEKVVLRKKRRFRKKTTVFGTSERPRLCVFRSGRHMYAQVIDDIERRVLASATTLKEKKGYSQQAAVKTGAMIAERALKADVKKVIFDVSGYCYHGRVKALAESARKGGLEF